MHLTIGGSPSIATEVTDGYVRCAEPSFDGPSIEVIVQPADPATLARLVLTQDKVTITVTSGYQSTRLERDFSGPGPLQFDASRGAQVDLALAETTSAAIKAGTLGIVTALTGSVSCGDLQRPGTTDLAITGTLPEGALAGAVDPANVLCTPDHKTASIIGLTKAGLTPTLVTFAISKGFFGVILAPRDGSSSSFFPIGTFAADLTPGGSHVDGDASLEGGGPSAPVIHVVGDVTCG